MDDDERVRSSLPALIGSWRAYEVVAVLPSADNLASTVVHDRPDVVVLDIDMPGRSPFHAIKDIGYRGNPCKVLALSAVVDARTIRAALDAGAAGYVAKADCPESLREGLDAVLRGRPYLSPRVADAL